MFTRTFQRPAARVARFAGSRSFSSNAGGSGGAGMPLALVALAGAGYVYYDSKKQVNDLQVQLSGKTNSAFVFIKPHACKGKAGAVEAVVEDRLVLM